MEELASREGHESWDQFALNKERFGIDSRYNEDLYTIPMSSMKVDPQEWEEVVNAAKEMENKGEGEDEKGPADDSAMFSDVTRVKDPQGNDSFTDRSIGKK